MSRTITGWKLPEAERERLLERFEPRYKRVIADHVTLRYGTDKHTSLPAASDAEIVGIAYDGNGVEALVIAIDGQTERGDGSHFHITWSLGNGRKAKESNDVMATHGWKMIEPAIPVRIGPAPGWASAGARSRRHRVRRSTGSPSTGPRSWTAPPSRR